MNKILKKYIIPIITIIYCIIFYYVFINIAKHHEAWADEAQAWLIARDTNFWGMVKAMKYEASPFLWHLILKFAIVCGLNYEKIYYIPLICIIIGIIFLFKNKKVPWIFKLTLPFTYFIFFQYTIISRSYCLVFPLLMMISYIYDEKDKKLIIYAILLILLMNVSLHGTALAGGLWLEFIYDKMKKHKEKQNILRRDIVFIIVLLILFILVAIIAFPKMDCTYGPVPRYNIFELLGETIYTSNDNLLINIIASIFAITILLLIINKENYFRLITILGFVLILNLIVTCSPWHLGVIYLTILFLLIINDSFKNKKIFILILISVMFQIYWTYSSVNYDIKYNYSSGKEVSKYLKTIDYNEKKISAIGFHSVTVNSYFKENIYNNYQNSFYEWSRKELQKTSVESVLDNLQESNIDIYIIPDYNEKTTNKLIDTLENIGYTKKYFESYMVVKDYLFERTGFYILEKVGE